MCCSFKWVIEWGKFISPNFASSTQYQRVTKTGKICDGFTPNSEDIFITIILQQILFFPLPLSPLDPTSTVSAAAAAEGDLLERLAPTLDPLGTCKKELIAIEKEGGRGEGETAAGKGLSRKWIEAKSEGRAEKLFPFPFSPRPAKL